MPWLQRENNLRKVAKHDSLLGCKNQEVSVRKQVYGETVHKGLTEYHLRGPRVNPT